jgi:tetratricopeptide (TPR) repeat protein
MLAAFHGRRPFEAFLWMMELQLGGAALPALSAEQKGQLQADPAVRRLSQALAVKDQDGLRQALGTLQWLRTQTQPKRYLLKLFEANDRAMLGDYAAARAMYEDVLQANPALAGAYKDIGDFYFRTFDTAHAWRCWDIGRRLAPQFGNLGAITQFERSLATQFPEYF